jgi:molybdate transport repressor ModE-like protein
MSDVAELWSLDLRHLAALNAIARTRSISRAAEELGYGQSAVSQQLAGLERVVGHRLVDRGTGPRPVTLTAAGESLLGHARWILDRLDTAKNELERLASGDAGSLRVGTFQSAGARLLPSVLAAFHQAWPSISLALHTESHDGELAELVLAGSIDVAFVENTQVGPGLEHLDLVEDRYVTLVPPGHRLAAKKMVSLSDFEGEDLIDGTVGDQCTSRSEQARRNAGIDVKVVFRTQDNPTRQRLVDAGLGCAVLPGLTVEPGLTNGAVIIPLKEDIHRTISLAWASDRTPTFALLRFIDIAEATLRTGRKTTKSPLHKTGKRRS